MIKGIQITQAANDNLVRLVIRRQKKAKARCLCAKGEFAEDQVVAVVRQIEYRELPVCCMQSWWPTFKRERIRRET